MGVGAQHCPLGLHALWGLRAVGVVGGCPRGGRPATVVRGVWCQALSLPRLLVLWGGQPGFRDPCVPAAVGAGVGTQHRPHSVRPCGPALLAVGVASQFEEDTYNVKKILGHRTHRKRLLFKVRWEDYTKEWDTDQPVETFLQSYNNVWRDYLQKQNITQTIDLLAHLGGPLS